MRKIFMVLGVSITLALSSCQKNDIPNTKGTQSQQPGKIQTIDAPLTVGQKHNVVLEDYIAQYGFFADDGTTRTGVERMVNRMAVLQASRDWLNTSASTAAEDMMDGLDNLGIFNIDGTSKTQDQINSILVGQETNAALKQVMTNIMGYAGDPEDFMDYADNQFASLTSLTGDDLNRAEAIHDVLGNSHGEYLTMGAMFDALTLQEKAVALARADAAGAIYGAKFAIANGHWFFMTMENDIAYWSVGFSVKAAQM
jgi:hypothetical protein